MSADEDTELRDLVAQTLENNGVLGKIRAELRASVFLALEEQDSGKTNSPFINEKLKKFLATKEGYHAAALVKEFLEYFNLDFTVAVFNPETNIGEAYEGRSALAADLDIADTEKTKGHPLLTELLRRRQEAGEPIGRQRAGSAVDDLTSTQIADAKAKFEKYDKDESGSIDKDELRNLFIDMFPNFHRNMLERYVNDEFRAGDQDFSSGIDFDEFLTMYRRLFVICRSVVSHDISDIVPTSPRRLRPGSHPTAEQRRTTDNLRKFEDDIFSPLANRGQRSSSRGNSHSEDSDAFFDKPLPSSNKPFGSTNRNQKQAPGSSPPLSPSKTGGLSSLSNAPPLGGSGLGSLGSLTGAPPINANSGHVTKGPRSPDWGDLEEIDKKITKLGFDLSQKSDSSSHRGKPQSGSSQDYEDDFQSSSQDSPSQTPRGSNSQRTNSITEEISEEISGDDSFLASSQDNFDDQTSDHTVSQLSQSGPFDYMEEVRPPTEL